MLTEILTACCLVLVIEGLLPFLNPEGYKQMIRNMLEVDSDRVRMFGLCSMIVGVVLLTVIR